MYGGGSAEDGNSFGYHDEEFEALIAEGDRAEDLDAAVAKYAEAERMLAEDFPSVPISFSQVTTFHSDRVGNVVLDPFSGAVKLRLLELS